MVSSALAQVQTPQPPSAPPVAATIDQAGAIGEGNPLANRAQVAAALRFLQAQGVKLTTLGTEGGLPAYLGESPNGRMQVFYVTPDGSHVVAGLLFDSQGANITGVQLGEMQRRFDAAQKQLAAPTATPGSVPAAPQASAPAAQAAPAATASPIAPQTAPAAPASPPASAAASPAASSIPAIPGLAPAKDAAPAAASAPAAAPATAASPLKQQSSLTSPGGFVMPASASEKYLSLLDRGAVERMLGTTPWFQVGVKEAPAIYMVVDPQCPYCHRAWTDLQRYVYDKKIQLRIIMIAGLKNSPPLAISILSRANPGEAWLSGEGSIDNFAVKPPPAVDSREYQDGQRYLDLNAQFVRTFGITSTPTFLYIGKDERLYSTAGLPQDIDGFMAALF